MKNIPNIIIKDLEFSLIQGGMGIGVSKSNLASAVAEQGGAGIIASVGLGLDFFNGELRSEVKKGSFKGLKKDEKRNLQNEIYARTNSVALADEIRKAREKTNGVIGVNIMYALSDYVSLVKTAVRENVDLIICGAGMPRDLPNYLNGSDVKIIPIVSDKRAAKIINVSWSRLGHPPDAIIVEGPKAGGHLGYSLEQLNDPDFVENGLERVISEVISEVGPDVPIIAAGGIYTGEDIYNVLKAGASGVQMATRFVTTYECDADAKFKLAYIDAEKDDLAIIKSPVGMPGRAIKNAFVKKTEVERVPFHCDYDCLKPCIPAESPYCIADALMNSQKGFLDKGFVFGGTNAYRATEIVSVKDVFTALDKEYGEVM
jgi:nitronate monooxygenase